MAIGPRSEDRADVHDPDDRLALAAEAAVRRATALLRASDGGERVVVFPHGQGQRAAGGRLEQVIAAAEAGLGGDPVAVAGDILRIEVSRNMAVLGEAGNHRGSVRWQR